MRQDVKTDASVIVNVGVEHFCHKFYFRSLVRVVIAELDDQIKNTTFPDSVVRPKNDGFPVEKRVASRRCLDAFLCFIVIHLF